MLSGMLYLLCRVTTNPAPSGGGNGAVFTVGFLGGLMPFTKMQGLPIAFALCLILMHALWLHYRRDRLQFVQSMIWLVIGGVLPSLLVALYLSAFSIWDLFWHSYIQTNLLHYSGSSAKSMGHKLLEFVLMIVWAPSLAPLIVISLLFAGIVAVHWGLGLRDPRIRTAPRRPPHVVYALLYLLAAAFAVAKPGNSFRHYLLLLIMPLGFLLGTGLGETRRAAAARGPDPAIPAQRVAKLLLQLLLMGTAATVAARAWQGGDFLVLHERYLQDFRGPVARAIRGSAPLGSTMAVWGFSPNLFVESGMVQSTRYGCTVWQIEKNPLQSDFVNEFLMDMRKSRPQLFIDAIAPGMFYVTPIDRTRQGHEAFPAIGELIRADYALINDVNDVRIYRRKAGR
jgi:hypothetical protein